MIANTTTKRYRLYVKTFEHLVLRQMWVKVSQSYIPF
jgi:hypothetical protein